MTSSPEKSLETESTNSTNKRQFQKQPHRCYNHLHDVLIGLQSNPLYFREPFTLFWKCLKSEKGYIV